MSARVKLDEDLPRQIADLVAAHGHDAVRVVGQGWQGVTDDALWPRVQAERRWLITLTKAWPTYAVIRLEATPA